MADSLTPEQRSLQMALVKSKNTRPELALRRILWGMGVRYRLHAKDLPGTPDIVNRKRRKAIFVHGCFWHRHPLCSLARLPKSHRAYWRKKLEANAERDRKNIRMLKKQGFGVLVIWECQLQRTVSVEKSLQRFLTDGNEKR